MQEVEVQLRAVSEGAKVRDGERQPNTTGKRNIGTNSRSKTPSKAGEALKLQHVGARAQGSSNYATRMHPPHKNKRCCHTGRALRRQNHSSFESSARRARDRTMTKTRKSEQSRSISNREYIAAIKEKATVPRSIREASATAPVAPQTPITQVSTCSLCRDSSRLSLRAPVFPRMSRSRSGLSAGPGRQATPPGR